MLQSQHMLKPCSRYAEPVLLIGSTFTAYAANVLQKWRIHSSRNSAYAEPVLKIGSRFTAYAVNLLQKSAEMQHICCSSADFYAYAECMLLCLSTAYAGNVLLEQHMCSICWECAAWKQPFFFKIRLSSSSKGATFLTLGCYGSWTLSTPRLRP